MNNNDILNGLNIDGEQYQPSNRLDPLAIENSLNDVKRKNNKKVIGACVTLFVACVALTTVFISNNFIGSPTKPINANSYDDIYKVVNSIKKKNQLSFIDYFSGEELIAGELSEDSINSESSIGNPSSNSGTGSSSGSSSGDYSDTNIQVEGVDEADIVKTDGNYIYSVKENKIYISNPNNGKPEIVSTINTNEDISEIFLHKDKVIAICEYCEVNDNSGFRSYSYHEGASVIVYDLTDITSPKQLSSLSQEGYYISSRKINNVIYLTTNHEIYDYENIDKEKPETYCPVYSVDGKMSCINPNTITISNCVSSISYTTVASIDLDKPDSFADICSVLGGGDEIYASHSNIYITSYNYNEIRNINTTEVLRFSIDDTEITENGSATVSGDILNQFSMDEYNGYFRIVTETSSYTFSDWFASTDSTSTALYVLDENLKLVGKTEDVAKGENVKSVRFDGDIAYFVTFRQTDPLFAVDLSNPENPKILSKLKIPGFSEYMHIMSDDLLLGFGRDANIESGWQEGLKLSMFDTSDKTDVKEIATEFFGLSSTYSEAEYNHKAIYVDEENLIIGVPYEDEIYNEDDYTVDYEYSYAIFQYDKDNNTFIKLADAKPFIHQTTDYYYDAYTRGLKVGEYFYIVTNDSITSYNYSDFEKVGELNLK